MRVRAPCPADRPTPLAGPMQLPQPTPEIPELGGLVSSRRSALAEQGLAARREIGARLGRARRRARGLALLRGFALFAAGAVLALCAGALLGSFAPATVARGAAAVLLLLAAIGVAAFSLRSPLQRAAARDDVALARLLSGSSELLSSVELSRAPEQPGISRDLLSLLHVRAADQARSLDVRPKLPLRSAGLPLAPPRGASRWGFRGCAEATPRRRLRSCLPSSAI